MKQAARFLSESVRDPRALAFGLAVFVFWWVCVRPPEGRADKYTFMATLLLAASTLTLWKRFWSSLVAAALGGYLPVQLAYEFWTLPQSADVPFFGLRHFTYFAAGVVTADPSVFILVALSASVFACSARTLGRTASV